MTILRILFVTATALSIVFLSSNVFAEDPVPDWTTNGTLTLISKTPANEPALPYVNGCHEGSVTTKTKGSLQPITSTVAACVVTGKYISIAYAANGTFASYRGDSYFYKLGSSYQYPLYLAPDSDRALFLPTFYTHFGLTLNVFDRISSRLEFDQASLQYNLADTSDRVYPTYDDDTNTTSDDVGAQSASFSNNGKYLVFARGGSYNTRDRYIRVDLSTGETKEFGRGWYGYVYSPFPKPQLTISNDGQSAVGFGIDQMKAWHINDSCLIDVPDYLDNSSQDACPSREILAEDYAEVTDPQSNARTLNGQFTDDGTQFSFIYKDTQNAHETITVSPAGYSVKSGIDYLALGDSYSSGEGDTERNSATGAKYYRDYTDNEEALNQGIPREKCHISTRSYPYILSQGMALGDPLSGPATKWQTVACGGAQVYDANSQSSSSYKGQGKGGSEGSKPRLEGYGNWQSLKAAALNEFIPGRQKQIEFVKKYKPKVITLTMGGNDVGFGDKLKACATPQVSFSQTCQFVTSEGRSRLAKQIITQYGKLKVFYEELYEASGKKAKVYILGYPKFVNGTEYASCGGNIGALDREERKMMSNAVELMNNVIEQATKATGVKYIDTEDSLDGGKLCDEGQEYMTGITGIYGWNGNQEQESFHPNAKGNFEIAMKVWDEVNGESLINYDFCPAAEVNICPDVSAIKENIEIPTYFDSVSDTNSQYTNMTSGKARKSSPLTIMTGPYVLRPSTSANVTMHSEPTNLGDFTVAEDGSLEQDIPLPSSLPAGYHTLIVTGESYSGEQIELEQVVLVEGADPDDVDENGILDSEQSCGPFMQASDEDSDLDGIDDACDPYIDPNPRPVYQLRTGKEGRTYLGSAEREDYLYLERNVHAGAITGVSGDYDPDNDGYTIVAASKGSTPSGRYANLQIDTTGQPNQLYISFRTIEDGCVKYKPTDLSKVTESSLYRTFTQEAVDTNTCREQPADGDLDDDNQPDNLQALYEGRNGDPSKGETPAKLYLFRSTRAAEAQLGASDYAPNIASAPDAIAVDDTTDYREYWSLLAHTKSNPLLPVTFKKIHMIGSIPYVLATTDSGNLCQAYKPQNTATIKQSTQSATNLVFDTVQTLNAQVSGWCG